MSAVIHRLVYRSSNRIASADVESELAQILAASRRNNARDGLTGALLLSPCGFAQVLEGPIESLERTFERIQRDARHGNLIVLEMVQARQREFPDWSMAFPGGIGQARTLPLDIPSGSTPSATSREILALLKKLLPREGRG